MRSNIFDRLSFLSLLLTVILLPFFFLPFTSIPIETAKGLLLVVGLVFSVIFWAIARFFDGKIVIPKSISLVAGGGVVLAFFLSSLFAKSTAVSFFGTMFDLSTFWFIFSAFLFMFMSSIVFRDPKKVKIVLFGAILSSAIVLTFQTLHLFIGKLSLGVLASKTDTILGSWNSLGIFAGFTVLMSLLVLEFFSTTKIEKLILKILTLLALFIVVAVNFPFVWVLLGISSLIIFVYKVSINSSKSETERENTKFPLLSFTIIIASLLFFMSGALIGNYLPDRLGLVNNEMSLSLSATMSVTKSVLKAHPVFGSGPNTFAEAWSLYKPLAINGSQFWDASFSFGSGLLPTLTATTGYVGILAWLIFFTLLLMSGARSIFTGIKNGVNWEIMAFFVLSLYLFISAFFYATGSVIFLLALAFTGVFIGLSATSNPNGEIVVSFLNDHRKSFFSILSLVVIIVLSAAMSFMYLERFASIPYFRNTFQASTIPMAESSIGKALSLYQNDLYLRTYAQVYLTKFTNLTQKGSSLSDSDKVILQSSLDQAVNSAVMATHYNPSNYLNFQTLGSVYQNLGVKDSYSKAVEAYKLASNLNPFNPGLKLAIASASFADSKTKEAKDYATQALNLKPDYVDAMILLSQIAKNEGNNSLALEYAQAALSHLPANKNLIQYVESLKSGSSSSSTSITTDTKTKTPIKK